LNVGVEVLKCELRAKTWKPNQRSRIILIVPNKYQHPTSPPDFHLHILPQPSGSWDYFDFETTISHDLNHQHQQVHKRSLSLVLRPVCRLALQNHGS